jgi:hypothetical protein
MPTSNFNLRGIPSEIMTLLKQEAKRLDTSVNSLVLKMVERGLGFSSEKIAYHDLDHLAGSWSASEEKIFKKNTHSFEQIDEDLWE